MTNKFLISLCNLSHSLRAQLKQITVSNSPSLAVKVTFIIVAFGVQICSLSRKHIRQRHANYFVMYIVVQRHFLSMRVMECLIIIT